MHNCQPKRFRATLIQWLLLANIVVFGSLVARQVANRLQAAPNQRMAIAGNGHWAPTEEQIRDRNQGVGWVFGRVVGAAQAPGSPNNQLFGPREAP